MTCARCNKPEAAHPVVPWFGMKCYEFQAPPPVVPPKPRDRYVGAEFLIGVKGDAVIVEFSRNGFSQFQVLPSPAQARFMAQRLLAMADILDPPKPEATTEESPSGDGGGQ